MKPFLLFIIVLTILMTVIEAKGSLHKSRTDVANEPDTATERHIAEKAPISRVRDSAKDVTAARIDLRNSVKEEVAVRSIARADADAASETADAERIPAEMEFFDYVASLPGAYDLAYDIRDALERDPSAIDLSAITKGPDAELRPDYLERMIRDPMLRKKWVDLMKIIESASI